MVSIWRVRQLGYHLGCRWVTSTPDLRSLTSHSQSPISETIQIQSAKNWGSPSDTPNVLRNSAARIRRYVTSPWCIICSGFSSNMTSSPYKGEGKAPVSTGRYGYGSDVSKPSQTSSSSRYGSISTRHGTSRSMVARCSRV